MIYHLRKRLPKKGGNQWYLDNRIRKSETYCGADCTDVDSDWRSKGETWTRDDGEEMICCPDCLKKRLENS